MMDKMSTDVFLSQYDGQVAVVIKLFTETREIEKRMAASEDALAHAAYKLHNLFNSIEELCKIVAAYFENNIDESERFHKNLLDRMFLEVAGVRPAIFRENVRTVLSELLRFRHRFRHAYDMKLDIRHIAILMKDVLSSEKEIVRQLEGFKTQIRAD